MELWEVQNERSQAMLLMDEGKLPEAKERLDRIIARFPAVPTPPFRVALANCRVDRATVSRFANEWEDALAHLSRAQSECDGLLPLMRYSVLHNVHLVRAKIFSTSGTPPFDPDAAQHEIDALRQLGSTGWVVDELQSHVAFQRRDWDIAAHMALQAAAALDAAAWPRGAASCRRRAGEALLELERFDEAEAELVRAMSFFEQRGPADLLGETRLALARVRSREGDHDAAWTLATQALAEMESRLRRFRDVREQQQFVFDKVRFYDHAFDIGLERGGEEGTVRAWNIAERAKSFYLAQLLANAQVELFEGVDPEVIHDLERAEAEMDDCERHLSASGAGAHESIEARIAELSRERTAKLRELMQQNTKWLAMREPSPFDVRAFIARLSPPWIPVAYFWRTRGDETTLHVFTTDGRRRPVHHPVVWNRDALQGLERVSTALLGEVDLLAPLFPPDFTDVVFPAGARAAWSADSHILISPHGQLRGLPLHALRIDGAYVSERWPVQYTPSLGLSAPRRAERRARSALIVGCVQDGFGDPPLPRVANEISDLASAWRAAACEAVDLLVAPDATMEHAGAAMSTWSRFDILHFACHGVFPADRPFDAALRIGADAIRASELFGLKLDADMVTLSACALGRHARTWGERKLLGDEWIGLYLPLFYAGARSLVVSLWEADSRTAAEFMKVLHTSLAGGEAPAVAFRAATAAVKKKLAPLWANWCLVGFPQLTPEVTT